MLCVASFFSQLLSLIPRPTLPQLVARHGAEKGAKGLTGWTNFTAMLFCQFVTRLKQNARYQVVDNWLLPQRSTIRADQVIRLFFKAIK